ncbi:MAG: broad specificity phosphatase PhoE [Woeseiaceae bacterium]|jgi:broad specificity phosphatase PhoE|tara:strand:- start:9604 stop:10320 length:717 start_codon:yes stop_codon:yes gene_type:complete
MSHLFLIRHGQASFLSDNYDQLSDMGREQAKILGKQLVTSATNFDVVYSGDLVRQIDTAEIVANVYLENEISFPEIQRDPGLNEYPAEEIMTTLGKYLIESNKHAAELFEQCNNAKLESERHRYFQKLFELILEAWVQNTEEVELSITWDDWSNRVRNTFQEIMMRAGKSELIGVFTSGGPIGVSLQTALDAPQMKAAELNWRIYNSSMTKYTFSGSRFSLDHFNDVSHLPKELLTYR